MLVLFERERYEKSRLRGKFRHLRFFLYDNKIVPANELSQIKENVQNKGGEGGGSHKVATTFTDRTDTALLQAGMSGEGDLNSETMYHAHCKSKTPDFPGCVCLCIESLAPLCSVSWVSRDGAPSIFATAAHVHTTTSSEHPIYRRHHSTDSATIAAI